MENLRNRFHKHLIYSDADDIRIRYFAMSRRMSAVEKSVIYPANFYTADRL